MRIYPILKESDDKVLSMARRTYNSCRLCLPHVNKGMWDSKVVSTEVEILKAMDTKA